MNGFWTVVVANNPAFFVYLDIHIFAILQRGKVNSDGGRHLLKRLQSERHVHLSRLLIHSSMTWLGPSEQVKSDSMMSIMDAINRKMGKGSVMVASSGMHPKWVMRREKKSPSYTTEWEDISVAW